MCNPVGIAFAALSAIQIDQQNKSAAKQADTQAKAVNQSSNIRQTQLQQQAQQAQSQAGQQANQQQLAAAQQASAARASAGEAGVTGTGVNRITQSIGSQAARNIANINSNLSGQVSQVQASSDAEYRNQVASIGNIEAQRQASTSGPLESIARIGSSYFGGANLGSSMGVNAFSDVPGALSSIGRIATTGQGMLPAAATAVQQAQQTGFSDDFLSGDFLKRQLTNLQ